MLCRRLWGFIPVSVAGVVIAVGGWILLSKFGRGQSDFVLHAAGIAALAITGVTAAFTLLGTLVVAFSAHRHVRRTSTDQHPVHAVTGNEIETGLSIPALTWWPFVDASLTWERPGAVEVTLVRDGSRLREVVVPRERGRTREIVRRFEVRDIFGLAHMAFSRRFPASLHVAPATGDVRIAIALRDVSGEGYSHPAGEPIGEMVEMRRYAAGDPLRFVLWKTYARTRRLLVRAPERAITPQRSTVAYMVAGPGDEPSASVARTFVEDGLLGADWSFCTDGAREPTEDAAVAVEALIDSAGFKDRGGEGFDRLLTEVDPHQLANCIVFVPGQDGPWVQRIAAFASRLPRPPTCVLSIDTALAPPTRGRLARMISAQPPGAKNDLEGIHALYDSLRAIGGPVQVVHRPTGRLVTSLEVEAARPE